MLWNRNILLAVINYLALLLLFLMMMMMVMMMMVMISIPSSVSRLYLAIDGHVYGKRQT